MAVPSHFPPHPLDSVLHEPLYECLHREMGIKWAKLGLEVRLADETLEFPHTDRFSLLGQGLVKANGGDEMFNLLIHMLYRWASGMKSPFPAPSQSLLGHTV